MIILSWWYVVNDEMLRLSLIDIMNMDLLNDFVNKIFGYRLGDNEFVYIQYKIVKGNIFLNIFDNVKKNRFRAFIYTLDNIDSDDDTIYINVKDCYDKWKSRKTKKKLYLLGGLLYSNNNIEKKEIIESLFDDVRIKYVLYKYFIL